MKTEMCANGTVFNQDKNKKQFDKIARIITFRMISVELVQLRDHKAFMMNKTETKT